jgi:membrane protein implicated in regulation of membrane protease activity
MTLVWIAVALIFAVAEVATVSLFAAFLSIGAVGAAIIAFFFVPLGPVVQALVFGVVSLFGVVVARPWLLHRLSRRATVETVSGATAMIGEVGTVVRPTTGPEQRGHVRILGENWPAESRDGSLMSQGAPVRIVDIQGTTLIVEPVAQDDSPSGHHAAPGSAS